MSSIISQDQEIHPITAKLLDGTLSLSDITLEMFDNGRKVYHTQKEARCNGYDAEHIVSVSTQIKRYNKENNTTYNTGDRQTFLRETGSLDDRCYRLTKFEHLVRHYLKAKEDPDEYIVFGGMKHFHYGRISRSEINILESLKEWSEACEESKKKFSESKKLHYMNMSETEKEILSQRSRESNNRPEVKEKKSNSLKKFYGNISEGQRQKYRDIHEEAVNRPEVKEKISKSLKEFHSHLSDNEKEKLREKTKIRCNTPDSKRNMSNSQKERFRKETPEEKEIRIQKHREGAIKNRDHISSEVRRHLDSMTEEAWKRRSEILKEAFSDPEVKKHMSEGHKRGLNTPEALERKAKKQRIYRQMLSEGVFSGPDSWNQFSSWYGKNKNTLE